MNEMLDILGITVPIYLTIALGFASTRMGLFAKADMQVFGRFTLQLALPALLFNALSQRSVAEILNLNYLLAYALGALVMMVLGLWWARQVLGQSLSYSSMMAMGMSCPNSGFVGYPIILLSFGPVAGVALALNMVVENFLLLPLLLAIADAQGRPGQWKSVLLQTVKNVSKNPMIWGVVAGFAFSMSGLEMPAPVGRTIDLFAQSSAVLALFVIGGSLVGLQARGLQATVLPIALGKLVLSPMVMWTVLMWWVPIDDPALRAAALLTGAMPMLGIYTILNQRHGHGTVSAAALLVTTVLSFFTLSALLWLLKLHPV
jgi:predicted permease